MACKKYALLEEPVRRHTARALAARPRRAGTCRRPRPRCARAATTSHSPTFTFGPDISYKYYINNYDTNAIPYALPNEDMTSFQPLFIFNVSIVINVASRTDPHAISLLKSEYMIIS